MILYILCPSCKSHYRHLKPSNGNTTCIAAFTPRFSNNLYSAYIDVTKHHFSGILLFKVMPDSSIRIVFTNEVGVKFFDFGFTKDGTFTKHYALPKLDKKVVISALRNDLNLILLHPAVRNAEMLTDGVNNYITAPNKKGNDYYITDNTCSKLIRIEKASKRKPVVIAELINYRNGVPDSINVTHKKFKFNIALKRVEK